MFTVLEIQDTGEQVGVLTYSYNDESDANAKYFTVLAAAAKSTIRNHSAILVQNGFVIKTDCIQHWDIPIMPEE